MRAARRSISSTHQAHTCPPDPIAVIKIVATQTAALGAARPIAKDRIYFYPADYDYGSVFAQTGCASHCPT